MPRPRKWRRVCGLPKHSMFGPLDVQRDKPRSESETVVLKVEEYEAIRWIDYEGLIQEECAEMMNVARTTVQRIYDNARKKVAQALVEGKRLTIEGGDYQLCDGPELHGCGRGRCHRHQHGRWGRFH